MLYLIRKHKGLLYEICFCEAFNFLSYEFVSFFKSYMYAGSYLWFADALVIHPKTLPGKGTGGLYGFKFCSICCGLCGARNWICNQGWTPFCIHSFNFFNESRERMIKYFLIMWMPDLVFVSLFPKSVQTLFFLPSLTIPSFVALSILSICKSFFVN